MVKTINTLIPDIYSLVQHEKGWFNEKISHAFRDNLAETLANHFNAPRYMPGSGTIRMSGLGAKCPCALWYSVNHPEMAEKLQPWAEVKFSFGYILEALVLALARAAGHEVTGEQDELVLDGIIGHRDAVVDGMVVDVKSCSSIAFSKFKNKTIGQNDSFGYLDQLGSYVVASANDPLVRIKDRGAIIAIDKTLGHMVLYEHTVTDPIAIIDRISTYKKIVSQTRPPACECGTRASGASGNVELDVKASYSPYKFCCHPHLRTFIYGTGPKYLTKVCRTPDVPEITQRLKRERELSYVYH